MGTYELLDMYCAGKYGGGLDYFMYVRLDLNLPTIRTTYFRRNDIGIANRIETVFVDNTEGLEDLLARISGALVRKLCNKKYSFFVFDRIDIIELGNGKLKVDLIFKGKK